MAGEIFLRRSQYVYYSLDQVRNMLDVNLYGVLRTYQAVLPSMRANRNGLIINITSGASGFTVPFMIPYLISKFGVESITEGSQEELKAFGIENVSIQPGVYPTEMTVKTDPQKVADGILQLVNMEKGQRPLRYPIDIIAQGTDQEFVDSQAAIKTKWLHKYGYSL